jgi:hypothetical protein
MSIDLTMSDTQAIARRSALQSELRSDEVRAYASALRLKLANRLFLYFALAAAVVASIAGLAAGQPVVLAHAQILPWQVSLLTAAATSAEILRRRRRWREKCDAFYALRDSIRRFNQQLRYELPEHPTVEDIAEVSRRYTAARESFGKQMYILNAEDKIAVTR